jgi:hypothetical protein
MASITQHNSGWRVFVHKHGQRKTKVLSTYAEASAWAEDQERRLDGVKARFLSEKESATLDLPLLTAIPVSVLDAIRTVPHCIYDVISAAIPVKQNTGIYFLILNNEVVYVGQSIDLLGRVSRHIRDGKRFDSYAFLSAPKEKLDELERKYIRAFVPVDNISFGNEKPKKLRSHQSGFSVDEGSNLCSHP